jgi:hypothetical protein
MSSLITYDVSTRQDEVKAAMLAKGYKDIRYSLDLNCDVHLPASTLWKDIIQPSEAIQALKAVVIELNSQGDTIRIRRAVAANFDTWGATCGEEFGEQNPS